MRIKLFLILLIVLLIASVAPASEENITLSTYYPAPHGQYKGLSSNTIEIDIFELKPSDLRPTGDEKGLLYYDSGNSSNKGFTYFDYNINEWGLLAKDAYWHKNESTGDIYYGVDAGEGGVGIDTSTVDYDLAVNSDIFIREGCIKTDGSPIQSDTNTFLGVGTAGNNNLTASALYNTAVGKDALYSNTSGEKNTAVGWNASRSNTTGSENTALGTSALCSNTTGNFNTAAGNSSLHQNQNGSNNTAGGYSALRWNVSGNNNTAVGHKALSRSKLSYNTAAGANALFCADTDEIGTANTAVGYGALENCYVDTGPPLGSYNTAVGKGALSDIETGSYNTAVGTMAGRSSSNAGSNPNFRNTCLGWGAGENMASAGSNNILIGYNTANVFPTSDNIVIGYDYTGVPYLMPTNTMSINGLIFADLNQGYVGIGEVNPSKELDINGSISATGLKLFDIKHPDPAKSEEGWRLRHACVETPTGGDNIYIYEVEIDANGGKKEIGLPSYWKHLNNNPQVFVSAKGQLAYAYGALDEQAEKLIVTGEKKGIYNILLIGTRKDKDAKESFDTGAEYKPKKGSEK
ncbi:MAG: hypothetical protein ABH843_05715 [Candidatus Omnitrophota bacterium]